ncbi:MAG: hypothetical protein M0R51_13270 [Clostridia bacterium]|jgi:hypothetical protein|nr:hypothetical protein [Clostridia bacterium]
MTKPFLKFKECVNQIIYNRNIALSTVLTGEDKEFLTKCYSLEIEGVLHAVRNVLSIHEYLEFEEYCSEYRLKKIN